MSQPYAFETNGRVSAIPIALWTTHYEQGTLETSFKLTFKPVAGAYVACVSVSRDRASAAITPRDIRYGRSNSVGWVLLCEMSELGEPGDIPSSPTVLGPAPALWFLSGDDPVTFVDGNQSDEPALIYGLPNEAYRIFWTYDKTLFEAFAKELARAPHQALDAWGARLYIMEPFGDPASLKDLDILDEAERKAVCRLLLSGPRQGYHSGWHFEDRRTAAIFDATPASFRALYLSEWLEWYSVRLRADKNWSTLMTALHVSAIAEQGGQVMEFERLGRVGRKGVEPRALVAFADYRRYAYECAVVAAGLAPAQREAFRDRFLGAIYVLVTNDDKWKEQANGLRKDHGVEHPWHRQEHRVADLQLDAEDEREPLIAYFDYYAEGLRCESDGLVSRIRGAMTSVDEAFAWIGQKRQKLLQASTAARHDMLMRDIGLCTDVDLDSRLGLADRHARQCATLRFAWWVEADEGYLKTPGQWAAYAEKLQWLSGVVNGAGDALGGFIKTYLSLYQHTPGTARAAIRLCLRYERWLTAGVIDDFELPTGRGRMSYRASGVSVSLSIEVDGHRKLEAGKYRLLKRVAVEPARFEGPTGHVKAVTLSKVSDAELEAHFRRRPPVALAMDHQTVQRLEARAGLISTLGALLDIGLAVQDLANSEETGWQLFTSDPAQLATWATLQGVESGAGIISAARQAMGLAPLSERALVWAGRIGGVGVAYEGTVTLMDGYQTVYSEDGDMVAALDRGEQTRALLELTKGVSQMTMGVGGVVAGLAGMAGISVVAGPFALVFGVGSVAVAVTQAAIYIHTGGGNRVEPLITQIRAAERSEFHLDERNHTTEASKGSVRLRQRVAVLNELINRELPRG